MAQMGDTNVGLMEKDELIESLPLESSYFPLASEDLRATKKSFSTLSRIPTSKFVLDVWEDRKFLLRCSMKTAILRGLPPELQNDRTLLRQLFNKTLLAVLMMPLI